MPPEPPAPDASLPPIDLDALGAGPLPPPTVVEGPMLRAIYVALDHLTHRFGHPGGDDLTRCLSRLDAYDVQVISETTDRWVIWVGAREWRCYDAGGGHLTDADGTFEVSKDDFSILSARIGG